MTNHVISGLIRRRREVAGDILDLLAKVDVLANDLDTLDRALRVFDPDIQLDQIPTLQVRPQPDWAVKGEMVRAVFTALRGAAEPMPTRELTEAVLARRGIEGEPTRLQIKRVRKCLDRQRQRGALIGESVGGALCWRVR
ncbi:hypothetical protein [Novosphingobium sp.]|uniref:hypothetical protein n=1 Tax=Novosphingobium sp. TaxID=1874826 RepID=UPI00286D0078|nr:hypothetical protein [Novosphingobium sp.]